ncbi:autotransporter domain-containing protein [uncultured Campylobacter sp.]|uniref:autotransporter domain-containing protein n=2 Tax=Campylobacter TaxID=194 RepID=UPI00259D08D0|nr:autotransporter domain-containing protein [uncultured Campylobacter sp.]
MQGSQGNPLTITTQNRVIAIKTNGEANINAQYAQITANTSTGILVSPNQTNNNIDLDSTTITAEVGIVNTGELQRLDIDSTSKVGATANGGINGQAIVNGQSVLNGQSYETTGTANRIGVLNNEGTIEGDRYGVVNSGVDKKSRIDNLTNANTGTIKVTGAGATAIYNGNDLNQNGSGLDYIVKITNKGRIEGIANGIANLGQIDTIDNDSGITGNKAIYMADTGAILGTLDNDGQIVGTTVAIENDGTITTITNKGIIQGATTAIDNDGSITTLSLHRNSQLTSNSTGSLIDNDGTITTLENNSNLNGANIIIDNAKDIGTIENFHNINGNNNAINHTAGTITKLDNKAAGTISGNQAINIANGATITDLTNSGTIESRNGAAIGNDGTITNLNLQATSQLIGSNNVMIDNRNTITNLTNNSNLNGDKAIINRNTIGTLTNNKTINGTDNAIEIAANATIDTLTNAANAIITGANQAIEIIANATIGTLTNSGKIESTNNAAIDNDGSITTLELEQDSELISNVAHSLIDNDGIITTLRNRANLNSNNIAIDNAKDIGTIENHNIISGTNNAINHAAGTITTLDNKAGATILGNQAIAIANGALITTLNNSGTIESRNGAAIGNDGTITNLNLQATSQLIGSNNVMIDNRNTITNLTNNSNLNGDKAIINRNTIGTLTNNKTINGTDKAIDHTAGTITNLNNEAGATILGNQAIAIATGATIENFTNAGDIEGAISIYNNGTIGTLDNSGNISGDIYNTSPNTLRVLKNSGSMGNIYNTATGVMGTDDKDNAIENKNGTASIKSINNAGIIKAKMYAIKNDSGSINDIVNEGKIIFKEKNGAQIYNDGTATAAISKWNIKLNQDAKDYNDLTKIDTTNGNEKIVDERIFVGGNKLDGIKFGKEAIVLTLGPDGGLGEYDLGALVVKNNGGNAWVSAATEVTGVSDDGQYTEQLGITCANLRFDDTGLLVAKCSNNRIDISADLDKSIAADLPSVWVNNYIMSSTIRNSIISDIMMSSIGLLQGDDSGRSDQEEKKEGWHIFAIPYANYSWQSVYGGKAHTYTYGIMSGWAKNLNEYGVIGGFVGYENSDTDMPRRNEIDSNTRYIGGSYYNEFPINSIAHPYVKAVASYTNSNPNIYTKTDSADTYLNTVSAGVAAGLNIYLGKDVIIPEVGIDYNYFKMGSYTLGSERYGRSSLKLPIVNGSLGWQRDYGNNFYTMLKGGVKHLLEDTHETPIKYGIKYNDKYSEKYSGDVKSDMPTTIGTISAGLGYNFNSNTNLTLNYQGGFAKDTRSHTGTAKIEYRF